VAQRFVAFHGRFSSLFRVQTQSLAKRAEQYLHGLMQAKKKNMERMAEKVPDTDEQSLQHFLSNSPWDERPVLDQAAQDADRLLGGHQDSALYIDETGILKKGRKSVGVSRQWIGQYGKVDNCQVTVVTALGCKENVSPIDFRLYLPRDWTKDKKRCRKAGVPEEAIVFKNKHDLALEMIAHARAQGIRYNWISFDGFYGESSAFLRALDQAGEIFVGDVHKNQKIYLEDPAPLVPSPKSSKGRKPTKLKAQNPGIRVDKWALKQPQQNWQRKILRDTTKGKLVVDILHKRVWLWDGKEPNAQHWHLIIRREVESSGTLKYSISNAPADTRVDRLAYMQAQRYWIERSFQDAKNQCGMTDYQVRGWRGWHHHMTMVMLAMLFILEERLRHKETTPLLSAADVATLLDHFLPRRDITEEEVLRQLEVRHRQRQASIEFAYRKQRLSGLLDGFG
jgi:SRSO17 transposase